MLLSRIIVALIFIPLLLLAVILRGPFLLVVVLSATTIACAEFAWMFHERRIYVSVPGTALVGLAYVWSTGVGQPLWPWLLGALALAGLVSALGSGTVSERARNFGLAAAGGTYVGFLVRYALLLGELPNGAAWGALALLAAWGADTGAYFAGRSLGRHALAPSISPRKTWEGVGGGLLLTLATVAIMGLFLPISLPHMVPLALAITVAAVTGDLIESALKRFAGVKDSSKLLAGHGGFLDRMDSLLLVLPVVYAYAVFVGR